MNEEKDNINIVYVDINLLVANPWNSNIVNHENELKLEESINRFGFVGPIVARKKKNGLHQIIGGYHRVKVAKKLGYSQLPVIIKDVSDSKAKEIGLMLNSRYGADDSLLLAELINSLDDAFELTAFLPMSDIEVETLMSATSYDFDTLDDLDDDLDELPESPSLSVKTSAIMRFKVSLEDASGIQEIIASTMKTNGFSESDALTNAGDALAHILLNSKD